MKQLMILERSTELESKYRFNHNFIKKDTEISTPESVDFCSHYLEFCARRKVLIAQVYYQGDITITKIELILLKFLFLFIRMMFNDHVNNIL